jgi:predicted amidohydrolase YtcJ
VRGGRIVAVGSDAEIAKLQGPSTKVIDANGAASCPASSTATRTCRWGGLDLLAMDLRKTKDPAEFTRIVAEYAKKQPPECG